MAEKRKAITISLSNGTKTRVYIRGNSDREINVKLQQKIKELESNCEIMSPETTFKTWAEKWLAVYKTNIGEKNRRTYEQNLEKHIYPFIGHLPISKIKPYMLQEVLNAQQGKSTSHVGKIKMTLNQIFKKAKADSLIKSNPAESIELPQTTKGTRRSITEYEREKILETAETHRSGLWIKMLLYCGLRPGETRALLWSDIDFKNRLIKIKNAAAAGESRIKTTKTNAGIRTVPIANDYFFDDLCAAYKKMTSVYVFTQPTTGKPHTEESVRCLWENFKRQLDINMGATVYRNQIINSCVAKDLTPYCLRHTFCTDLQRAGVPLNIAKYLMGHSDITVTANIYTHQTEDDTKNAAIMMLNFHHKAEQKEQA